MREETGADHEVGPLIGVYDQPGRDPRGWIISIAYLVGLDAAVAVQGADDAEDARWWPIDGLPTPLAFDHETVISDALAHPATSDA